MKPLIACSDAFTCASFICATFAGALRGGIGGHEPAAAGSGSTAIATAATSLAVLFNIESPRMEVAAASLRTVAPSTGFILDREANEKLTSVKCQVAHCLL